MEINGENEDIYKSIIENSLINYNISEGEEMIIPGKDDFYFQITNTKDDIEQLNDINNKQNNFSIIDLGHCEILLKNYYHINNDAPLLILKYEKFTNISTERILQYEIYEPYNKTKLNLSICSNTSIDIYTPVILSEELQTLYENLKEQGYDLFDINSPFYQDICTPYKSINGNDVILNDRINYFYNNNETVCQSNCKFSDYLMNSQYKKCNCDIMNSNIDLQEKEKFNPKLIYQSFYSVLQYSNYKVLFCYKLAFCINSLTKNLGSIISIILFLFFVLFLIIYIICGKNQLNLIFAKAIEINLAKKVSMGIKNCKKNKKGKINNEIKKLNLNSNNFKNINKKIKSKAKKQLKKVNKKIFTENLILSSSLKSTTPKLINITSNNNGSNNNNNNLLDCYELNNLEYLQAKKLDDRNLVQIYCSLLKREHPVIFTFITKDDYNITKIKYSRFIFLLCTDMAMNVFFFSDETMHKMYLNYGKYDFIQQIPQIAYSTFVSKLLETFLCFLSMTDNYYYRIKNSKNINKFSIEKIKKVIKTKIVFFYISTILIFVFYWYLITCFCAVYQNTQITFFKDSLSSFILNNLLPFIIYLFPAILRLISLRANLCCAKCLYQFSNIIPFF